MTTHTGVTAMAAGGGYFVSVFSAGFALGAVRELLLMPFLGKIAAVLLELPLILAIAWAVCRKLIVLLEVPPRVRDRLIMGSVAFALLQLAEFCVSALVFGRGPLQHLVDLTEPWALLGLAGQVAFAVFPTLQLDPGAAASGRSG